MNCCRFRRLVVEASLCKSSSSSNNAGRGLKKDGSLRLNRALILCRALSLREATAGGKLISDDVLSVSGRRCLRKLSVREETKIGALAPPIEGKLKDGGVIGDDCSDDFFFSSLLRLELELISEG